jgi:hypothetical protein
MAALISQNTNLKSLRYGKDRVGGGSSNQPYIKSSIPENSNQLDRSGGVDFLLRGGTLTPSRAAKDVSRLTKMFFDFKSPNGILFTAKQNLLSRTGVKTQASGILNEGVYLPTSTILQAGGNAFGIHLNKQGLDPTKRTGPDAGRRSLFDLLGIRDPLGLPIYTEVVTQNQEYKNNRLVQLANRKLGVSTNDTSPTPSSFSPLGAIVNAVSNILSISPLISTNPNEILKYGGGPGSTVGIGKTTIKRYSFTDEGKTKAEVAPRTSENLYGKTFFPNITPTEASEGDISTLRDSPYLYTNTSEGVTKAEIAPSSSKNLYGKTFFPNISPTEASEGDISTLRDSPYLYTNTSEGVSKAEVALKTAKNLYGKTFFPNITPTQTSEDGIFTLRNSYLYTNTNDGLNFSKTGNDIFKGTYYVLDSKTLFNKTSSKDTTEISDFRKDIPASQKIPNGKKNILSAAPDYRTKNIENRVNLGNPGKRNKNVSSYTSGLLRPDGTKYGALDKITATPLYSSAKADHGGERNDLVKFSIGIIKNDDPSLRTYIHFRAFLDSMEDSYSAEWNDFKYMGRGEKFYRYNGFSRTINLGWTVAAQSKEELIPMYQKLNFLASSLAPDYSANGYMRGNLAVLTVGGYVFEQPGIINSINYSIPDDSPWEIGINDTAGFDDTVKEMPHIIKVTGFSFTPIHTFVPKLQQNKYDGANGAISEFGSERYIALSKDTAPNASTTNYNPPNNYIS